jgi:hypothetical protein
MMPTRAAMKPMTTIAAASADGKPRWRSQATGGPRTVAMIMAIETGKNTIHT